MFMCVSFLFGGSMFGFIFDWLMVCELRTSEVTMGKGVCLSVTDTANETRGSDCMPKLKESRLVNGHLA